MRRHIILTSHPSGRRTPPSVTWGAPTASERGPIIASADKSRRNVIGAPAGAYAIYQALAVTVGRLSPIHVPDLTDTLPAEKVGPYPEWAGDKIVSLDPWGHLVAEAFADRLAEGWDIRPTIAITKAHIRMPELIQAIAGGRLRPDGKILMENGSVRVTKAAIEPVWYLPGIAKRFGLEESELRHGLFQNTGGMFPGLVTRPDLKVFLPPIGGVTVYCIGEISGLGDPSRKLACRVHDECNGSDVFGSDICTCRPYLAHGIEVCVATALEGGAGVIVYNRKEGRALGEVVKFLVYNARKRQEGGDRAATYFARTECVAGVEDLRFQELMPDILHWLGIKRIHRFVSMSDLKFQPIVASGIEVVERVEIPEALIPSDAKVEIDAKVAAGYFSKRMPAAGDLEVAKGRSLDE
jgi:GTP cyclohydrolase II